jgi:hypothetical protein
MTRWTLACATVLGAVARMARAEEPPAVVPPPDPPPGVARVALGLLDPFRTSRIDLVASGPKSSSESSLGFADVAFAFVPRGSIVATEMDWAWVGLRVGGQVDSSFGPAGAPGVTSVLMDDVELDTAYSRTLAGDARGDRLLFGPRGGIAFPSSKASKAGTIRLRTSLGLGMDLHVPLLHGDWLRGVLLSSNVTWERELVKDDHVEALPSAAPARLGIALLDQNDYFSAPLIPRGNQLGTTISGWVTLYRDLSLGITGGFSKQYYARPPPCIGACPDFFTVSRSTASIVDVALGYALADAVWIAVGYDDTATTVSSNAPNALGPGALFYGQVSVLLDGVYEKARRAVPSP